jgi:transposase
MPGKRYKVKLETDEREQLRALTSKGRVSARVMKRAQILLKADEGWRDQDILAALEVSRPTVERTRQRFVEGGMVRALYDAPRPGQKRKLDGRGEAQLIALACSRTPEGRAKWSVRLLADKLVELGVVESISHEAVRQRLKKMR